MLQHTGMSKTALYLRQSKDRNHHERAVARQREDCLKLCAAKGWHTPTEYVDNDISASTELRDDLRRANDSDPADNLLAFLYTPAAGSP